MVQNIIVVCIVVIALAYAVYLIVKRLTGKSKKSACSDCPVNDCDLKNKCK